jgi:hypothetical protein
MRLHLIRCLSLTCAEVNADNSLKLDALMDGAIGFKDVPLNQHVAEYRSTVGCVPELFPGETCMTTATATTATGKKLTRSVCGASVCEMPTP